MSININDLSGLFENNQNNDPSKTRYDVKVMEEKYDDTGEKKILILQDHRNYIIEFPCELYIMNSLSVHSGNMLRMSREMYETWFERAYHQDYKHLSDIAFRHFDKLLEHSDLILQHEAYFNIRLPFLQSLMIYVGSRSYSLGALLKSWIETDTFLLNNGTYMLSVSGSPLSGMAYYKAWCPKKKEIIYDDLSSVGKTSMSFFKKFEELEKEYPEKNISDLSTLKALLSEPLIEIKYKYRAKLTKDLAKGQTD
jgi:hypothetical protein